MLTPALGALALCLSTAGYALFLRVKGQVEPEFLLVSVFSGTICVLFLGGVAGLLFPALWLVLGGGMALLAGLVLQGLRRKTLRHQLRGMLCPGTVFFLLGAVFLLVYLRGSKEMLGDCYNHWATMAKVMFYRDQLPDYTDAVVVFQSYPPGSALFLYLVTKLVGFGESRLLWAQGLLCLACLCCLFAALRHAPRRKQVIGAGALLLCCYVLLGQCSIFDLLVDSLVGMLAMAAAIVVLHHAHQPAKGILLAAPMMTACLLVKNSGAFFVAANTLLFLALFWRAENPLLKRGQKADFLRRGAVVAALALPFLALLLWNAHVDAAFPAGAASYHAMRSERLLLNYSLHSPQEIRQVGQLFLGKVFSLTRTPLTLGFLGWNAAFFAAAASCRKTSPKASRGLLGWILFADGVTALYLGALYLTYITSMPLEEALALAAFDRYFAVAWAYTSGVSAYLLCREWAAEQAQTRRALLALGLILPLAYGAVFTVSFREVYARRPYQGSFYQLVDDQIAPLGLDSGAYSYYVIGPADGIRGGTTGSYLKYKLLSMEISVDEDPPDSQHIYSASQNYDYLLVLQDSDAVREFFQGYPQYAGRDSYVGLYPLPLW